MREQQAMSTSELANATGTSSKRIDALEAGRLDLSYALLLALAEALRTQPSTLVALAEQLRERTSCDTHEIEPRESDDY